MTSEIKNPSWKANSAPLLGAMLCVHSIKWATTWSRHGEYEWGRKQRPEVCWNCFVLLSGDTEPGDLNGMVLINIISHWNQRTCVWRGKSMEVKALHHEWKCPDQPYQSVCSTKSKIYLIWNMLEGLLASYFFQRD